MLSLVRSSRGKRRPKRRRRVPNYEPESNFSKVPNSRGGPPCRCVVRENVQGS